jgi:iron complex outermembrane receptor protein
MNDLYWQPGGNPDLKPEFGISTDVFSGLKSNKKNTSFYLKINIFAQQITDWILWQPTEFHYWTAMNIKQVFSRGFDAKISFFHKGKISYKIITNYALTKSTSQKTYYENDASINKQLIYTPIHTATADIFIFTKNFDFSVSYIFTGKQFTNTANYDLFTLPAYSLVNTSVTKNYKFAKKQTISISLYINNVFNKNYQAILFRPMPGRNAGIEIILYFEE